MSQSPRIQLIQVKGLFGLYDHSVNLTDERITVIHGANGVGKTVFLKLTNAFLRARFFEAFNMPFRVFEIWYDDGTAFSITASDVWPDKSEREFRISYKKDKNNEWSSPKKIPTLTPITFAKRMPYLSQIEPDLWIDRRTDELFPTEDLISRIDDIDPRLDVRLERDNKEAFEFCRRVSVHYIEAQRLFCFPKSIKRRRFIEDQPRSTANTVQEYSSDLKDRLSRAMAAYATQSQELDQSFPVRLLHEDGSSFAVMDLKRQLGEIESERERLRRLGILDGGDMAGPMLPDADRQLDDLPEKQRPVLSVYVRDTKEKLNVLKDLSNRIEILLDILNKKFSRKTISVSRQAGLIIRDENGRTIPVTALSSGEQHEIVLLYDLLFRVEPNSLVLIDEPELSLHLAWQKSFLDEMFRIIELSKFDVLMATHSPYIVGDHTETLVEFSADSHMKAGKA
ncbi:MAG TPA: AAA family ATPase [Kiritimatiellia bacterium]|nr:AAA family ATPase [Kiritimatiellia bacterium]